jgi:hypothetical protein
MTCSSSIRRLIIGLTALALVSVVRTSVASSGAVQLRNVDGGQNYYSQFSNSLPSDPSFFPVGVWLAGVRTQRDIDLDKAAGLNLYVGMSADSNFSLLQASGMYLIAQQNELRANQTLNNSTATVGWLLYDEIDMVRGPNRGYTELQNILKSLPTDRRLRYNNYGKGVMFWGTDAEAARFVNAQDVTSVDRYWFTDPRERHRIKVNDSPAAYYGYSVDRVRALDAKDGVIQPIWNFVEVGWPYSETAAQGARAIQPSEIKAAVWHSIIAGARGIIYFVHSFGGSNQSSNVLRDPEPLPGYAMQRAAVTETNALIKQLAPVLNAPFADDFVSAGPPVRTMAKFHENKYYVFAGNKENRASITTLSLSGVDKGAATVIGENRMIPISNGRFSDSFLDGNAIHIYRIDVQ